MRQGGSSIPWQTSSSAPQVYTLLGSLLRWGVQIILFNPQKDEKFKQHIFYYFLKKNCNLPPPPLQGDHSLATSNVFVLEPGTEAVIFNVDGCLSTSSSLNAMLIRKGSLRPLAKETVVAWARKVGGGGVAMRKKNNIVVSGWRRHHHA